MNKIILNREKIPQVAIDFMNATHFEELDMVASLGELINNYQQGESAEAITAALQRWYEHTIAHFDRENELMIETHFPMYLVHSGEHKRVLDEMYHVIESWKNEQRIESLSRYVFEDWPQWFEQHVNSMDMVTAQFAVMHGYDPHQQIQG